MDDLWGDEGTRRKTLKANDHMAGCSPWGSEEVSLIKSDLVAGGHGLGGGVCGLAGPQPVDLLLLASGTLLLVGLEWSSVVLFV